MTGGGVPGWLGWTALGCTWLLAIARNEALMYLREERVRRDREGSAEQCRTCECDRERPEHHGQRPRADAKDLSEGERAAEQDDRELQEHRRRERDAGDGTRRGAPDRRRGHAEDDREHRRAEQRHEL